MWSIVVSGAVGLICLVAALLMWTVGNRQLPIVIVCLVITGMAGILNTGVGGWIRTGVNWLNTGITKIAGTLGMPITLGLAAAALTFIVVAHVIQGEVEDKTLLMAGALPAVAGAIPGVVGSVITGALSLLTSVVAFPITFGFGL
jgi:hypothetical protein